MMRRCGLCDTMKATELPLKDHFVCDECTAFQRRGDMGLLPSSEQFLYTQFKRLKLQLQVLEQAHERLRWQTGNKPV